MKQFSCGDVVPGCTRRFTELDDDAILAAVAVHARADHGLDVVPVSVVEQVRRSIVSVD